MSQPAAFETRHTYTIHGKIAAGGMGTIRLGLQLVARGFSRVVAIKQIHPMYAYNQEFLAMFHDEFRVASRIVHPNVVALLDVLVADDELSLVMEYIHGLSISRLRTSAGGPPSPEIATTIAIGMLHGLHAAHEALSATGEHLNVVHRDVTPQNVVVGVDGTPRLLDFGIAHALGRSPTTRAGRIRGKARYLAPEQLEGGPIDRRADIYSASVVLWEMLTGRRLFPAGKGDAWIDLASRHSVAAPHLIRAEVSPHLSAIVLRGLQPRPEARYATALEMAVALEEGGATVSATKVGQWVRRVWGSGGLARLEQIRAIERESGRTSGPGHAWRRGPHHSHAMLDAELVGLSESSETEMTVRERPLGRVAPAAEGEPTVICKTEDRLLGAPRDLPAVPGREEREEREERERREPEEKLDGQQENHQRETSPSESPRRANGLSSVVRTRPGRTLATSAGLVAMGAVVLVVCSLRRAGPPTAPAPLATSRAAAANLPTTLPARITAIPVIEFTSLPLSSTLPPEAKGPDAGASPQVVAQAADHSVARAPRRRAASVGRSKPRGGAGSAPSRSGPRKALRMAPAGPLEGVVEETAGPPPSPPAPTPCDPPYLVDADGIKRFKLSCL